MARNSFGDMSDGADRVFSDTVLFGGRLPRDARLSRAFLFATFFGAVSDFGKAPNRFGRH